MEGSVSPPPRPSSGTAPGRDSASRTARHLQSEEGRVNNDLTGAYDGSQHVYGQVEVSKTHTGDINVKTKRQSLYTVYFFTLNTLRDEVPTSVYKMKDRPLWCYDERESGKWDQNIAS